MRATVFAGMIVLAAAQAPAQAEGVDLASATLLLPGCQLFVEQRANRLFESGYCAGLVEGISYVATSIPRESSCKPPGVTISQMVSVVVTYIQARPKRMHEDFKALAIEALHKTWPCEP